MWDFGATALTIQRLHVSRMDSLDVRVWHYNRNRSYIVKSGYRLLYEIESDACVQVEGLNSEIWVKILQTKLPRKILMFTWRVLHEIIPIKVNLANRKLQVSITCDRCGQMEETIYNALR